MIVTIILFGGLVLFLLLGFPIAIAIFLATLAGFLYCDVSLAQMVSGIILSHGQTEVINEIQGQSGSPAQQTTGRSHKCPG